MFMRPGPDPTQHNHHHHHHYHYVFPLGWNGTSPLGGDLMGNTAFENLLAHIQAQSADVVPTPKMTPKHTIDKLPKFVLTPDRGERDDLMNLPVKSLKNLLRCYKCSCDHAIEKIELVESIEEARGASSTSVDCNSMVPISKMFGLGCDRTCTMCFEDFLPGDSATRLPCGHVFHVGKDDSTEGDCPGVTKWLAEHANSCPNCKSVISDEDIFKCQDPDPPLPEMPEQRDRPGVERPFERGQGVEYLNSDGDWEPAEVAHVGYDDEVDPYYTVYLLRRSRQERGTIHSRLRIPSSETSAVFEDIRQSNIAQGERVTAETSNLVSPNHSQCTIVETSNSVPPSGHRCKDDLFLRYRSIEVEGGDGATLLPPVQLKRARTCD